MKKTNKIFEEQMFNLLCQLKAGASDSVKCLLENGGSAEEIKQTKFWINMLKCDIQHAEFLFDDQERKTIERAIDNTSIKNQCHLSIVK